MTRVCGECPCFFFRDSGIESGRTLGFYGVGYCRYRGDFAHRDAAACRYRRAFEVLRDEVRRLRRENERLVSEGGKP